MKQLIVLTLILQGGKHQNTADYVELNEYITSFDHRIVLRSLAMTAVMIYTDVPEEDIRLRLLTMIEPEFDHFSVDPISQPSALVPDAQDYVSWLGPRLP